MKLLIKTHKQRMCPEADTEHKNASPNDLDVERI